MISGQSDCGILPRFPDFSIPNLTSSSSHRVPADFSRDLLLVIENAGERPKVRHKHNVWISGATRRFLTPTLAQQGQSILIFYNATIPPRMKRVKHFIQSKSRISTDGFIPNHSGLNPQDLARIHQVVGVYRALDRSHHLDRVAMFGKKEVHFAIAYSVFAGAGAVHF